MLNDVQAYVPLAGVAAAVTIWLRQYWLQQRLTSDIVDTLRRDNEDLRRRNSRLERENTALRAHADELDLSLLSDIAQEENDHE